jgi:hypothetical protein
VDAAPRILEIHGQRVRLDSDLAALYGVTTKRLNEQVRRNADRFPADFLASLHGTWRHHGGHDPKQSASCADERVRGPEVAPIQADIRRDVVVLTFRQSG